MNRENIKKVRDHIAVAGDEHFDMRNWDCGTSACIGGWTDRLCGPPGNRDSTVTARTLGLDEEVANELFFMTETPVRMMDVTREHAVRVLDHLLETGEVDWSIIDQAEAQP